MTPEKIETTEKKPATILVNKLSELVPGEYNPNHRQSVTRYIDGQLRDRVTVIKADGRFNVITDIGKQHSLYWVTDDAFITPMGQSDLPNVLEFQIPKGKGPNDVAESLLDIIDRSSSERPKGRIAKAMAKISINL